MTRELSASEPSARPCYGNRVALAGDEGKPLHQPMTDEERLRQLAVLMATAATRKIEAERKAQTNGNGRTRS